VKVIGLLLKFVMHLRLVKSGLDQNLEVLCLYSLRFAMSQRGPYFMFGDM
jgi:hypothetical protein